MSNQEFFDPLTCFAEIERLVAKIYFRFSHLFLHQPELRDFWWQMAKERSEERRVGKECRSRCDWSSDVCSSDLFAEIERLVAKIYFRFSHLFLHQPELRDFWWQMAKEEEQHGSILSACKALIENYDDETLDPSISADKAQELKDRLLSFLAQGIP